MNVPKKLRFDGDPRVYNRLEQSESFYIVQHGTLLNVFPKSLRHEWVPEHRWVDVTAQCVIKDDIIWHGTGLWATQLREYRLVKTKCCNCLLGDSRDVLLIEKQEPA